MILLYFISCVLQFTLPLAHITSDSATFSHTLMRSHLLYRYLTSCKILLAPETFFPPILKFHIRKRKKRWLFFFYLFVYFVVVFNVLLTVHDGQQQLQNICIPVAYSNHFPTGCIRNGRFQPRMVLPLHLRTDKDRSCYTTTFIVTY